MSILNKDIQKKFIEDNFNKIVVYGSNIGRLIGYAENKSGFLNIIYFGYGHKKNKIYIDAGLNLTFLDKNNILFEETEELLSLNGNPRKDILLFEDLKDNIFFNSGRNEYVKHQSIHFFNKIVLIDNEVVRIIGFQEKEGDFYYICYDINNQKQYFDNFYTISDLNLNEKMTSFFDKNIIKSIELVVEII